MIELYYCPTPNCQKVSIALEELGLPYRVHHIDIVAGDQNEPAYAAICPNRKVPAADSHSVCGALLPRGIARQQRAAHAVGVGRDPRLPGGEGGRAAAARSR